VSRGALTVVAVGGVLPASVISSIAAAAIWLGGSASSAFALDGLPEATVHRYHFVASEPEMAARIPCYCGCRGLAHRSLLDCFVRPGGGYERHASGCGICGWEADDVERMAGEGMDAASIRTAIAGTYGSYGQPTDTQ